MSETLSFVIVTPQQRGTVRKAPGAISQIRTHAAKSHHAQRRAECRVKYAIPRRPKKSTAAPETLSTPKDSANKPSDQVSERESSLDAIFRAPNVTFVGLPTLKSGEKHGLWQYLCALPFQFGLSRSGRFSFERGIFWDGIHRYPLALQWILLEVDDRNSVQDTSQALTLVKRRGQIYKRMNELVSVKKEQVTDEFLEVVMFAICSEQRIQGATALPLVRAHIKGLLQVIELRGGLEVLFSLNTCMYHPLNIIAWLFPAEIEVSDFDEIRLNSETFTECLKSIREAANEQPQQDTAGVSNQNNEPPFNGRLDFLLFANPPDVEYVTMTLARFIVLFMVDMMLLGFGYRSTAANKFMTLLSQLIEDRVHPDTGQIWLSIDTMILTIIKGWLDFADHSPSEEVALTEKCIAALKTFVRLPPHSKRRVTELLGSWLLTSSTFPSGEAQSPGNNGLRQSDTEEILFWARSSWYESQEDITDL